MSPRHRRPTRVRRALYAAALSIGIALGFGAYTYTATGAATCTPIHDRLGDQWVRAEGTQFQGKSFDLVGGGTRTVGPDAMVSVGGTTYAIWPCAHGVGTS